ncbi:Inositol monophosphatase [Cereibacter sphaeroides WS8N]|uniref:inositol monophosphatase family protein n=1 Tax=Cereibacter sphaeroides TaxID=1063 RepID=UPI00020DF479|nr:inositol monophosphatase family protein [Cereibacter sphaeroides]EGJ22941.1 Inositol monophosphatase [Cereibacter sphaeroides WS8N]
MSELGDALRFANDTADEARRIALKHFRQALDVESKADDSPVTLADRAVEALIRDRIMAAFPDHGIFGEEEAPLRPDSDHLWVVDPIDGTKSYVTGNPLFGGLMALLKDGAPCLGQIDMPALGERWSGIEGQATTFNGCPCRTSDCRDPAEAFAYTTDPMLFTGADAQVLEMLRRSVRMLRFGGDCYAYALLASGHCDLVLETGLQPYDYLPLVQVIRGAGGVITDWQGQALGVGSAGEVLAAATPELHRAMLDRIERLRAGQAA